MRAVKLMALAWLAALLLASGVAAHGGPSVEVDEAGGPDCSAAELEDYNLGLHIGSVFILLAVSALAAFIPVLLSIGRPSTFTMTCIKLGTYFGIGTILSTAFIHMLLPANENLSSPCLPEIWNEDYEAWAFIFAVVAILVMHLVDFLLRGCYLKLVADSNCDGTANPQAISIHTVPAPLCCPAEGIGAAVAAHKASSDGCAAGAAHKASSDEEEGECAVHGDACKPLMPAKQANLSQVVGVYFMEAGIVFHSVLIGLILGVADGTTFTTLLIAISFHQFFEGFAIGSAIVDAGIGTVKALIMGAIYAVTTPIGIAIGIGIRESYNENAKQALLTNGILDALSAGVLIYVVIVQLLTPLMTQNDWLHSCRWPLKLASFACLYAGAAVMAVIGKWA